MNTSFTSSELDNILISLVTRERTIREKWLPSIVDVDEKNKMMNEADALEKLQKKVAVANLSVKLGRDIEPYLNDANGGT